MICPLKEDFRDQESNSGIYGFITEPNSVQIRN